MNMTLIENFRKQIALGSTMGLIIVLTIGAISAFLVIPFPDLRILLISTAIGVIGFSISLFANDSKDSWAIFFWFSVTLLASVLVGVLWLAFIPIDPSSLIFTPWLGYAGVGIAFLAAAPLFKLVATYKQSK